MDKKTKIIIISVTALIGASIIGYAFYRRRKLKNEDVSNDEEFQNLITKIDAAA